jgi:hypothetical protein
VIDAQQRGEVGPRATLPHAIGVAACGDVGAAWVDAEVTTTTPLAEVNGDAITEEDLERALGARLRQLEQQVHDLKRKQLDALIAERLLTQEAAKRGTSAAALLDTEVTAKVGLVTEQEVETFYQASKDRLQGEEAAVRPRIRTYLQQQKLAAQRARFVETLRAQAKIVDRLEAPPVVRSMCRSTGRQSAGRRTRP